MTSLHDGLAGHPLLQGLPDELIGALETFSRLESHPEGHHLLKHDVEIRDFYLLLSGQVALQISPAQNDALPIQTLNAGDALGWSWMIPPYRSHFDATALEPVSVIAIDCQALRQAMDQDHDLGFAVLKRMLEPMLSRLQACRLQVMDIYGQPDSGSQI